jgi:hypothetical protein
MNLSSTDNYEKWIMIDTSLIKITNYLTSIESLNYYMTDFSKIGCIKNNGNKISNKLMKSYLMQFSKWKFGFTGLNQILEFVFYVFLLIKTEKLTGPNKVLLVLSQRTVAHCEDCDRAHFQAKFINAESEKIFCNISFSLITDVGVL